MSSPFYTVSDDSFHVTGFPWIERIASGMTQNDITCNECGSGYPPELVGDLHVVLAPKKGSRWPDVLGCGAASLLIVSERVLNDWKVDKVGDAPVGGEVTVASPLPKALEAISRPIYLWLDPKKMVGAGLDREASGFVGVKRCSTCGRPTWDVVATYDRQNSHSTGYVVTDWNGANLFTTSASGGLYFCTSSVVECAAKHQHTNFRFVPIEKGVTSGSPGMEYLIPPM